MKRESIVLSSDRLEYFKRIQSSWFQITKEEEYDGDYKKIFFEYDTEFISMILLETFTYGIMYGIDKMSTTKEASYNTEDESVLNEDIIVNQ
jgi:hypothetical protein